MPNAVVNTVKVPYNRKQSIVIHVRARVCALIVVEDFVDAINVVSKYTAF